MSVQTQIRMVVLFPQKHSIQGPPRPNEKEGDYKSDSTRSQRHPQMLGQHERFLVVPVILIHLGLEKSVLFLRGGAGAHM